MRKVIRKKIIKEKFEKQLLKNERRIQKIAENSYNLRQILEKIEAESKQKPVEEKKDA
jgi:hypothetical protein